MGENVVESSIAVDEKDDGGTLHDGDGADVGGCNDDDATSL